MSTSVATLLAITRRHLNEPSARFWSDDELAALMNLGAHDLWGAINDNYKEYFATLDTTNVTLAANATTLSGVPTDVFRIELLEARDLSGSSPNPNLVFVPKDYRDPEFVSARALDAQDPNSRTMYYMMAGPGAPVSAPIIYVAPKVSATVNLTLFYVPALAVITTASTNPVPGESDGAIVAWTVAYARAKEREDRSPDPAWVTIYATEKANLLQRITPRQTQEADIADAIWQAYW